MSAIITPVAKARKRYRCDWDCGSVIEPGEAYVRWALPPGHEWNSDQRWRSGRAHAVLPENCPTFIHGDPREEMQVKARAEENRETVLALVTRALERELDRPPRNFPPDDWALIRSTGALRRHGDRMWYWTGWDWCEVISPDPSVPVGG